MYYKTPLCIFIPTRSDSQRVTAKPFIEIGGKTILRRIYDEAIGAFQFWGSKEKPVCLVPITDSKMIDYCKSEGMEVFQGSYDPLTRFVEAARMYKPAFIVRITHDCPLVTGLDIDTALRCFSGQGVPYYYNNNEGKDVEIFATTYLLTANFKITDPKERENVVYHLKDHLPILPHGEPNPDKWSVDTDEDIEKVRRVIKEMET